MTSYCFDFCSFQDPALQWRLLNAQNNRQGGNELGTREDHQKNQAVDAMLSQSFNRLTFQERQEQQDLLHGVDAEILEDKDFVSRSLQELDTHLIRLKRGTDYERAETMGADYAGNRSFRIMFLRGNRYDTKTAAYQMIQFFAQKQKLFGDEKLVKDITIDDLDEDDRACLRAGAIQVSGKDRSNRVIFLHIPALRSFKTLQSEMRVRYYIVMRLLENEGAQRRGAVELSYFVGDCSERISEPGGGYMEHRNLSLALPLHFAAFHACTDDLAQRALASLVISAMPAKARARTRLHFGTHLECRYLLSTYGIPYEMLPLSTDANEIDIEPHLRWYGSCLAHEQTNQPSCGPITQPDAKDVLFMRSKKSNNTGNKRLQALIQSSANPYSTATKKEKRRLVERIIDDIHKSGGRFLQQVKASEIWEETEVGKVREKITQRFRNLSRQTVLQTVTEGTFITDQPLPNDVIFSRAKKNKYNEPFHRLIVDRSEEYDYLHPGRKILVVDAIIERIKNDGGRFLQQTAGLDGYVELSIDSTRERVSTYFRNYRRSSKKATKQAIERSSNN